MGLGVGSGVPLVKVLVVLARVDHAQVEVELRRYTGDIGGYVGDMREMWGRYRGGTGRVGSG